MRPQISDVLADRYASTTMIGIWTAEAKIIMERRLWIAVLYAQQEAGMEISAQDIAAYEAVITTIDLESIREREQITRHDVKARIEEFNACASSEANKKLELVHTGMTSRDLTENVEQMQVRQAMEIVRRKVIAVLSRFARRAIEYQALPMTGRSHNVPAQMTTLGKRFATSAEELEQAFWRFQGCFEKYPLRGIKGPVGTQQDMFDLLSDSSSVDSLECKIAKHLGFKHILTSVGQVYPRSLDFDVISALVQIAGTASSFATTLRLMAGQELVTEGFKEGQVGSSAMPHKMNARSSERICGFYNILQGFLGMIQGPAGNQWNEGDVSCSVVRRVALQGAFLAIDGMLETWLTVLDEFGVYTAMVDREVKRYLPFLAATKLLMAAIKVGMGREEAHELIKKYAVASALEMRQSGADENPLITRLGADDDFPLDLLAIKSAIGEPSGFTGLADVQVETVVNRIQELCKTDPDAINYRPESIL